MTVLVAGAGPAGARLAIRLAQAGEQVMLVDPLSDPHRNAYSSAAVPMRDVLQLGIPNDCWGSRWNGWQLHDPEGMTHQWWANDALGVVLDFGRLRAALWEQACRAGVHLISGCRVALEQLQDDCATVELRSGRSASERRTVRWLVDATGSQRILLRQAGVPVETREDPLLKGEGVEWLLQADDRRSAPWRDRLSFFLGSHWVSHGYGWVFPMDQHRLKVGICRLPPPLSGRGDALGSSLRRLIQHCDLDSLPVLDRHGGLVSSTVRRDQNMGRGALIAVGDAAGTCNLLGGEGLRHALRSSDLLADVMSDERAHPQKRDALISHYSSRLRQRLGWRWGISGRLARRTWWGLDAPRADRRMLRLIEGLSRQAGAEDLSQLLFDYRFERYGPRLLPYLI